MGIKFRATLSERERTELIVLHHTGARLDSSAAQIHRWHLDMGWAGIGYHFVIRKDGTQETGRPIWAIGAHAFGRNYNSIGIAVNGDFTEETPTPEQIESVAMLLADLCIKYDIPIDRRHVVGHGELMATDCPGTAFQELLNDGTITGKGLFYAAQAGRNSNNAKERGREPCEAA